MRALPARVEALSTRRGVAGMATPGVPASIGLYEAAEQLRAKGHFARAAEKHGRAAAAAAQELKADDCLVVALLRAAQAEALSYHSMAPTLTAAEADEALQTIVSVLLPQCVATLTRRKAAGTLLPGSCRATEVAWFRLAIERAQLQIHGARAEVARAVAVASSAMLGFEAYFLAANVVCDRQIFAMPREMQLGGATFIASALDLMAQPRELPSVVVDGRTCMVPSTQEQGLAQRARRMLPDARFCSKLDGEALSLLVDAWRRVERSGAVAKRILGNGPDGNSVRACLDAAAAEAAVRGLRECALAGCAAKEVHVAQFKKCGACMQAAYCCREHQLEDWPAHKAGCKAARKAAALKS